MEHNHTLRTSESHCLRIVVFEALLASTMYGWKLQVGSFEGSVHGLVLVPGQTLHFTSGRGGGGNLHQKGLRSVLLAIVDPRPQLPRWQCGREKKGVVQFITSRMSDDTGQADPAFCCLQYGSLGTRLSNVYSKLPDCVVGCSSDLDDT